MDDLSRRFISAYNKIDKALRARLSLKPSVPFSDVVRRATLSFNYIKRYDDDLYAYARLRNAIVHSVCDNETIATPHLDTVLNIEKLEKLILTPPLALDYSKTAQTLKSNDTLLSAVLTMSQNDYSNMPVISDSGKIIGVITNKLIVKALSRLLAQRNDRIYEHMTLNSVASALNYENNHYKILENTATVDEVLELYLKNPKLQIVILFDYSKNIIDGIITTGDVGRLNEAMENS